MSLSQKSKKNKKNYNLKATFRNKSVTTNASATYIEDFKNKIGLKKIISRIVTHKKYHNAKYSTVNIIDFMLDAIMLGCHRFSHMEDMRNDHSYQEIKGYELPSEKVCRDLLTSLPDGTVEELRKTNRDILHLKASTEKEYKFIDIDCDDSVCTVFGSQEGAAVGYNPKYHGRPSYKEKFGVVTGTGELLDATLEAGTSHSNNKFLEFLKGLESNLPKQWILRRMRLDKGFFDEKTFNYLEEKTYEYVVKAPMRSGLQKIIIDINNNPSEYKWKEISSKISVVEITAALPTWEKSRRFIIIRKELPEKETTQEKLFNAPTYSYQAIVTNIDYMTPEEIFQDYNIRCNIENKIDELKEGFSFDQNSQQNKKCNELFLMIKMIAYNIHNWFRQIALPEEFRCHEINTLRRKFYKVAANIVGTGKYRHISYAPNTVLQSIVTYMNKALNCFKIVPTVIRI